MRMGPARPSALSEGHEPKVKTWNEKKDPARPALFLELLSNVVYGPLLSGDLVFPDSINETNVFDNLSKSAISPQPAPA